MPGGFESFRAHHGSAAFLRPHLFLPNSTFWAYQGLPGILFAFLSGMLIRRKDLRFLGVIWLLFVVLLAALAYSKFAHLKLFTGIHINVCAGYLLATPIVFWLSRFSPKASLDRWLGLLSFPLFLVHEPTKALAFLFFSHVPMSALLLGSIAVAGLFVLIIEIPCDKIRYQARKSPAPLTSG